MPARAFRVRTCDVPPLTPRPGCAAHARYNLSRAACSLQSSHSLPRALPPPPSYGAGYSRLPRRPPSCPLPCLRHLSLSLPVFNISSSFSSRGRLPTAMSLRCPLLPPAIACPRLDLGALHLISRRDSSSRRDRGRLRYVKGRSGGGRSARWSASAR
ncbi:hypothetical protein B0H13DRAFT_500009 [Mycena leptocephala]|nr:hypothetical protein B0H13DRAFT_500009 [Mycena leptocephala]